MLLVSLHQGPYGGPPGPPAGGLGSASAPSKDFPTFLNRPSGILILFTWRSIYTSIGCPYIYIYRLPFAPTHLSSNEFDFIAATQCYSTSSFLHTSYVGLVWCSTAEATASRSTVEGTLQLLHAGYSCHSSCSVPFKYPQRYFNPQGYCIIWDLHTWLEESGYEQTLRKSECLD